MVNYSVNFNVQFHSLIESFIKMTARIKAFIAKNGFRTNFILVLGLLAYVIVAIDFDTDFAIQRDEIDYVVAILSKSLNEAGLDILTIIDFKPPFQGIVLLFDENILFSESLEFPTNKAPPAL